MQCAHVCVCVGMRERVRIIAVEMQQKVKK